MKDVEIIPEVFDAFDVGALVGERRTLSKLAGNCSAADAICLRKIRETKQYLAKTGTWEEFCPQYLGISRASADRLIRYLEEFGPESFETMQQLGLSQREYRLLAPQVKDQALHHAGQAIRLLPENGPQIHAALREIRQIAAKREEAAPQEKPTPQERLNTLADRCDEVVGEFRALFQLGPGEKDRKRLAAKLQRTTTALIGVGVEQKV